MQMELGPVPAEERCQQVGTRDYDPAMARKECRAYLKQLQRQFPEADSLGVSFKITNNPHDFGTYHEVAAVGHLPEAEALIYQIEGSLPAKWDEEARKELLDYDAKAAEIWHAMNKSEKHGIRFGLFPAATMRAAEGDGYDGRQLTIALMAQASKEGGMRG
jgi:hypothetical protein